MITAHAAKIPPTVTEIKSSFSAGDAEIVLSDPLTDNNNKNSNNKLISVLLNASHIICA